MNSKLINQFLDSIDVITDKKLEEINTGTTVEATIIEKIENSNKYTVESMGARFTAISDNNYTRGSRVMVQRSGGSNIILGSAEYQIPQIDVLYDDKDKEYRKSTKNLASQNTDNSWSFSDAGGATAFWIKAKFNVSEANLNENIDYYLIFTVTDTGGTEHTFTFGINDVIGNPFSLTKSEQTKRIEFNNYFVKTIDSVETYVSTIIDKDKQEIQTVKFSFSDLEIYVSSDDMVTDGIYIYQNTNNVATLIVTPDEQINPVEIKKNAASLSASLYIDGYLVKEATNVSWVRERLDVTKDELTFDEKEVGTSLGLKLTNIYRSNEKIKCTIKNAEKEYNASVFTSVELSVPKMDYEFDDGAKNVNFTVTIDNSITNVKYQWYQFGVDEKWIKLDGATSNTYSKNYTALKARCVAYDENGYIIADVQQEIGKPEGGNIAGNFKMEGLSTFTYSEGGDRLTALAPIYFSWWNAELQCWKEMTPSTEGFKVEATEDNSWLRKANDNSYYYYAPSKSWTDLRNITNRQINVYYNNEQATFTFDFIRQGMAGTNGTNYRVEICTVGEEGKPADYQEYIQMQLNRTQNITARLIEINTGNEVVTATNNKTVSVGYSIWDSDSKSELSITINKTGAVIQTAGSFSDKENVCNIIRAEIIVTTEAEEGKKVIKKYYGFLPVVVYAESLVDNEIVAYHISENGTSRGFTDVLYSSSGKNALWSQSKFKFTNSCDDYISSSADLQANFDSSSELLECIPAANITEVDKNIYVVGKVNNDIKIRIPFLFTLNTFENADINGWDGSSIYLDNGTVLANVGGFGTKNDYNQFTGVVLSDQGLVAAKDGVQTAKISAQDGSAVFGKAGEGQIVLEPNNGGKIYGGNYSIDNNSGMVIDLQTPEIAWGNGNFKVDKDGNVTSKGEFLLQNDSSQGYLKSQDNFIQINQLKVGSWELTDDKFKIQKTPYLAEITQDTLLYENAAQGYENIYCDFSSDFQIENHNSNIKWYSKNFVYELYCKREEGDIVESTVPIEDYSQNIVVEVPIKDLKRNNSICGYYPLGTYSLTLPSNRSRVGYVSDGSIEHNLSSSLCYTLSIIVEQKYPSTGKWGTFDSFTYKCKLGTSTNGYLSHSTELINYLYQSGLGLSPLHDVQMIVYYSFDGATSFDVSCQFQVRDGETEQYIDSSTWDYRFKVKVTYLDATEEEKELWTFNSQDFKSDSQIQICSLRSSTALHFGCGDKVLKAVGLSSSENNLVRRTPLSLQLRLNQKEGIMYKFGKASIFEVSRTKLLNGRVILSGEVWINGSEYIGSSTSDFRLKNSIELLPEQYEKFFDNLRPSRYKYNNGTSNRYHTGYIAQDVVMALEEAGLDTQQFAGVVLSQPDTKDEKWLLRRDEFVALNTWQIQKLKAKVSEQDSTIQELIKRIEALEQKEEN